MLLNNTPIRTCKNFKMNNVEWNDKIPQKKSKFKNVKITQETEKDEVLTEYPFKEFELKYGTGLLEELKECANQNICVNVNSKTNKEIKLEFDFDERNCNLFDHIEIHGRENTVSNIYIIYRNQLCSEIDSHCDDASKRCSGMKCASYKTFHNGLIRVFAEPNAKLIVNIINLMNGQSTNILSVDSRLEKNSKVKFNVIDFGGKTSITNLYSNLAGEESNATIHTIYLGTEQEKIDMNYIAECYGERTKIDIEVQGALKEEAIKHFKGTIDFKKGCKKAVGNESENCMLLSDRAKSLALPMLLCSEEDVERKSCNK